MLDKKDYKRYTKELDLGAGTYYICFTNTGNKGDYTGRYQIETKGTASNYTETENNGSFASANTITLPTEIRARIGEGDEYDYYKFSVSTGGNLCVDVKSYLEKYIVRVQDSEGHAIIDEGFERKTEDNYRYDGLNVELKSGGTYYLVFTNYDGDFKGDYIINVEEAVYEHKHDK